MKKTAAVLVLFLMMTVAANAAPPGEVLSNELTVTVTVTVPGGGGGGGGPILPPPIVVIPPEPIPGGSVRFADVVGHWAEDIVNDLADREVVTGYPDGTFRPDDPVSRAETAAILCRALGVTERPESAFPDCIGFWFSGFVGGMRENGSLQGYPDATFRPANAITRAELAVVVTRIIGADAAPSGSTQQYTDQIPAWALDYVSAATAAGYFGGYADGTFGPSRSATRAELCAVVLKLLDLRK